MQIMLWEIRTAKGITLVALAEKSGIGKSTLNNIENEKVSPTLFQLEMIAIALDVSITDLFESEYKYCTTENVEQGSSRTDFHNHGNAVELTHNRENKWYTMIRKGVFPMKYKKYIFEMVEKIRNESTLKRIYQFVAYLYTHEADE